MVDTDPWFSRNDHVQICRSGYFSGFYAILLSATSHTRPAAAGFSPEIAVRTENLTRSATPCRWGGPPNADTDLTARLETIDSERKVPQLGDETKLCSVCLAPAIPMRCVSFPGLTELVVHGYRDQDLGCTAELDKSCAADAAMLSVRDLQGVLVDAELEQLEFRCSHLIFIWNRNRMHNVLSSASPHNPRDEV